MCAWLRPSLRGRIALQLVPRRVNFNIGQVGISAALQGELVNDAVVSVCCQRVVRVADRDGSAHAWPQTACVTR